MKVSKDTFNTYIKLYKLSNKQDFKFLISLALNYKYTYEQLQNAFSVSKETIDRWKTGKVIPSIAIRKKAVDIIKNIKE